MAEVRAEQAIFTSARSSTGEGYRLVAMSPGITSEERAEITRRSPSHGSLCDPGPEATALASYTLGTHRQCVAWSRHAGKEHTARGGLRVHTHLVVLEPPAFAAFGCDPFPVQAAMREALGDEPNLKPNTCLEPVRLRRLPDCDETVERQVIEQACCVAAAAVNHEAVLVVGTDCPVRVLQWTVGLMPAAFRQSLTASANLQYAPVRQLRLTVLADDGPEVRRAIQGQPVRVLDLRGDSPVEPSVLTGWCSYVLESWQQGRLMDTCRLASDIGGPLEPASLDPE